ncbi:MAG: aldose 1-epimerase family protein [Geothrix sp.]|uniref:aldose 1-epimerase family protein n=1 Tax=Geothrix sp. TaxID=1962974 RepID=UPI001811026D|nr:aldose 1-epimerase family protein [Geothrix sp.]NWJ42258.1 aldose 1-epimerase family protein [Geothrix sp.]WIL19775.1 MAG: aldose 1-epimerase family protein [Geothrix sp.]
MDLHRLHLDGAEAVIARHGAELQALRLGEADLLWNAGPLWPRHAPLLFPVVGGLKGDLLRHRGEVHPMPRHGFARDRDFSWLERTPTRCVLELRDDGRTREAYPFAFRLVVCYALATAGLRMELELHNPADAPLPASLGLHPAFRWPLVPGLSKAAHRLVFEADEPGPLRRLDGRGLLGPGDHPTPIRGGELALHEDLFLEDALIFLQPRSRSLRFEARGGPSLAISWEGFPHLGVWAKPDPGPSFLCIEPWAGYADPADWTGEFDEKPGVFPIAPGGSRRWSFSASLGGKT